MTTHATLLNFPGLPALGPEFHRGVVELAARVGADPDAIDAVMFAESTYDPRAVNKATGASGLIQILPAYAYLFGHTIEEIRAMSALEQLELVEKRYGWLKGRLHRPADYFIANIWPVGLGKPDDYVIGRQDDKTPHPDAHDPKVTYGAVYARNTPYGATGRRGPLDYDRDGLITVADLVDHAAAIYARAAGRPPIAVDDEPAPAPVPPGPSGEPVSEPPVAARGLAAAIAALFGYLFALFLGRRRGR